MSSTDTSEIRYLNPPVIEVEKSRYDRFEKKRIKFVDYKDPKYLLKLLNEQGKIMPRRLTGTTTKNQKKVAQAIKRARHLALLPYLADML